MDIVQIIKQNIGVQDITQESILYKGEIYTYFDSGLTRHVFVNPDKTKVIKFLISDRAHNYNTEEFDIYEKSDYKHELATTSIDETGLIIEQEFCNPIKMDNRQMTIKQILFAAKCRNEVGWDVNGNLKCFDLSEYRCY